MVEIYRKRRAAVLETLRGLGWRFEPPKGTFYLWVRVPKGYTSASFCELMLERCAVVLAPGAAYGQYGEGYVRFSLTVEDHRLEEALERMRTRLPAFEF
jgi:LL-diaminopimelate aminotransferase